MIADVGYALLRNGLLDGVAENLGISQATLAFHIYQDQAEIVLLYHIQGLALRKCRFNLIAVDAQDVISQRPDQFSVAYVEDLLGNHAHRIQPVERREKKKRTQLEELKLICTRFRLRLDSLISIVVIYQGGCADAVVQLSVEAHVTQTRFCGAHVPAKNDIRISVTRGGLH